MRDRQRTRAYHEDNEAFFLRKFSGDGRSFPLTGTYREYLTYEAAYNDASENVRGGFFARVEIWRKIVHKDFVGAVGRYPSVKETVRAGVPE